MVFPLSRYFIKCPSTSMNANRYGSTYTTVTCVQKKPIGLYFRREKKEKKKRTRFTLVNIGNPINFEVFQHKTRLGLLRDYIILRCNKLFVFFSFLLRTLSIITYNVSYQHVICTVHLWNFCK